MRLVFYLSLAALSALAVALMIRVGTLDHPGARSSHTQPTPKGGGVGIVLAAAVGMALCAPRGSLFACLTLLLPALVLAAAAWLDDVQDWPPLAKLGVQAGAALACVLGGWRLGLPAWPWLGGALSFAWLVFAANAINFIDGLNGLASLCVALAALCMAAAAPQDMFLSGACLSLAAGIAGFLPFNYPRARIFMGDVGSQFIGFVFAALALRAAGLPDSPHGILLGPVLLFCIWFDVVFTLMRRAVTGARLLQAHRGHLYQVAHRAGTKAWLVTLIYAGLTVWSASVYACARADAPGWLLLALLIPPHAVWLAVVFSASRRAGITRW